MVKTFEEFKEIVKENILDYLPDSFGSAEISVSAVTKNNDTKLTGLTIRLEESNIAPTIYLEQFYKDYENGADISDVLSSIADLRVNSSEPEGLDIEFFSNFDRCQGKIIPRVVNAEMNKELLKTRPHRNIEDLAVFYCILGYSERDGYMSATISNDIMQSWGVSEEILYENALNNMSALLPSCFMPITEVLLGMLMEKDDDIPEELRIELEEHPVPMYVLSNPSKMYGASALLDRKTMDEIADNIGDNYFVLPSSVHELIIVPNLGGKDSEDLRQMVREVNSTQVRTEEKLSDNVYRYSKKNGFSIVE